jgi:(2Fe-2S) ferredoxin
MALFEHHIFVCENERPAGDPRGCCAAKGSTKLREALRDECNKRGLKGIVRVNKAGCLDQCHLGPTVVIYPSQTWYGGVRVEDAPAIVDALLRGETVASLRVPDEHLTGRSRPDGGPGGAHAGNTPGGF